MAIDDDCTQFLTHVLPRTGPYCIYAMSVDEKRKWNRGVANIEAAAYAAKQLDEQGMHAFIAVGALIERESEGKQSIDDDGNVRNEPPKTSRALANIRGLRAYTMDIDAGPHHKTGKPRSYPTTEDAVVALQMFITHYGFPQPTIVQSGNGLHVWWTLTDEVTPSVWEAHGKALLDMALAIGFVVDPGRSSTATSVLRIAGRRNHKYADKPVTAVMQYGEDTDTVAFHALIKDVVVPATEVAPGAVSEIPGLEGGPKFALPQENTAKEYTPNLDRAKLDANCNAWLWATSEEAQAEDHIEEPIWVRMLQLAVHIGGRESAHDISKGDPRYTREKTDAKLDHKIMDGDAIRMGPPSCDKIRAAYKIQGINPCTGCPHEGKITSPAVVAHVAPADALPPNKVEVMNTTTGAVSVEEVPDPPRKFKRMAAGIAYGVFNKETDQWEYDDIFCPYDMYPKRLQANEAGKEWGVVWMVNYPHIGWTERHIEHVGTQQLRVTLMKWGIHVIPKHIDKMAEFMSAYTDKLQKKMPTEVEFSKCGWRDAGFVLGDKLINRNGIIEHHAMSEAMRKAIPWIGVKGERDEYIKALMPYGRRGLFVFREFFYVAIASIFYKFSGQIATTFHATGTTGVGKSTIMKVACAAIGDWQGGMIREFTRLGAEHTAGYLNNLPLLIDETTSKKDGDISDMMFLYTGGKGKIKLSSESHLRNDYPTWSNICLTNSNTDIYESVRMVSKDIDSHIARVIQVEYPQTSDMTKEEADLVTRRVTENFGHLIIDLLQHAVPIGDTKHKDAIERIINEIQKHIGGATNIERFKIAQIACAIYAMEMLYKIGYITSWPIDADRAAMIQQLLDVREEVKGYASSPEDHLSAFLDENVGAHTLVLNAKAASNINNVVQAPRAELRVRYEYDNNVIVVSRKAFTEWCHENGVIFKRLMTELVKAGLLKNADIRRVLGKDTEYAGGHVHCFEIDTKRLSGKPVLVPSPLPVAAIAAPKAATI